jgi:hypothetical protein
MRRPSQYATIGVIAPTHSGDLLAAPPLHGKKRHLAGADNTSLSASHRRFPSSAAPRRERSTDIVRRF